VTRLARYARLAGSTFASASYTAASFVASFVSVALIAGGLDTGGRAALFLFLALYSPLATVMSQRKLLTIYQDRRHGGRQAAIEEVVLFAATVAVVMAATARSYGTIEAIVLAGTVFSQIHASTAAGAIQHRSGNAPGWSVAVLALAAVRIGVTWLVLPYGPVAAFAAGSYAFLLAMLALQALTRRGPRTSAGEETAPAIPPDPAEAWYERAATFAFFAVGAVLFQVDKYALDGAPTGSRPGRPGSGAGCPPSDAGPPGRSPCTSAASAGSGTTCDTRRRRRKRAARPRATGWPRPAACGRGSAGRPRRGCA
jgi:hypothetical protein